MIKYVKISFFATSIANFSKLWCDGAIWKLNSYSASKKLRKMTSVVLVKKKLFFVKLCYCSCYCSCILWFYTITVFLSRKRRSKWIWDIQYDFSASRRSRGWTTRVSFARSAETHAHEIVRALDVSATYAWHALMQRDSDGPRHSKLGLS